MNPRKLLRIARWEVLRNAGGVDRRTVILLVVGLALLGAVVPLAAGGDASLDEGIYRIHVDEDSRYHQVAAWDDTFAIREADGPRAAVEGEVDLYVGDGRIVRARTAKGDAAAQAFRDAVSRYNDRMMSREDNATAAFPVSVFLEYRQPTNVEVNVGGGSGGSGAGDGGTTDGGSTDGAAPGGGGSGGVGGGGGGLGGILDGSDSTSGSPSQISPPFPFQSLVLAFVFVIPLNFLVQAYGSTMLSERINRRGELMLVSPVTRTDIIGGKTLPYFLAALAVEAVIAGGITFLRDGAVGGLVSVLAMLPLVLLFLGTTFLGAMFARSFKELTFVTVTITVTLTSYAFVPAIFTESNAIALISPLTLVVRDLQNEAITLAEFAFSVTPPTLTALVTFALGAALYREEDMFAQRPIPLKLLDSLAGWIRKPWHAGLVSGMLLPFIFVAELLAIALLFAFGQLSVPILLVFVAIIEELGKSLHVYGAYGHGRFEPGWRPALVVGAFSGLGFFLAEKLTLMAHLVGLGDELVGQAALSTGLATPPVLALSLLAPLALHTVTAVLSALGASRGRRAYVVGLALAVAVHLGYNLAVVSLVYV